MKTKLIKDIEQEENDNYIRYLLRDKTWSDQAPEEAYVDEYEKRAMDMMLEALSNFENAK